jgi:carboxymethylenebutenolidase
MGKMVEISVSDKSAKMGAYLAEPAQKAKAGIVVIQEIFGINDGIRAMTDDWAAKGYAAIAPDLFWRLQPGVQLDADKPEEFQEGYGLMQRFDMDQGIKDIAAAIKTLRDAGCTKVGAVGYCMGGRLAFLTAARTDSDATASYYGIGLDGLVGEAGGIKKPLLMHIATKDKFVPAEAQAKVHAALKGNPLVTIHDYDADHAFARHHGHSRVPALAELADGRTQAFFAKELK